ncbi:pyridoxal phosphate-dependent decarboxylase family protein [Lysobacter niastensis]|uniref:Aspartate aminotransferase family protein n=1 Tax=Lysobacter niastensis TaxID=380629 RepID=A0ABS0B7K4_9GAMM|nr:pyridoxal-dependent decarboxylase [Lysobacter niastensis]MBF6024893.1 aspartate aminotransferase family protein [Lysobacter niastensis]
MSSIHHYRDALDHARRIADEFLATLAERPVTPVHVPAAPPLPEGAGLEAAMAWLVERVQPFLSASPGPRYLGFVTGGATPEALAADWIASAWDQNVSNEVGSIAAALEATTVAAYADIFGLDPAMRGQFVSGATSANLVGLATARHWAQHNQGALPHVFAGAAHSSILKAMAISGIGRERHMPVSTLPGRTSVDPAALREALASHKGPAVVVASAGEVNTGDFDDLQALAAICADAGAWLHVDGAFGLFAAFDDVQRHKVTGVERADSVTVDLHKWLNVPYDSAIAYTRHPDLQREVFAATSAYLGDDPDPLHYTPENSRRFRALAAWMVLAVRGREGIGRWVAANCAQARALATGLGLLGLDVLHEVDLNIVAFAPRADGAAARDALLARINASGEVFMTPTVLKGRPGIRAAFSNWSTSDADVDRILAAVGRGVTALREVRS